MLLVFYYTDYNVWLNVVLCLPRYFKKPLNIFLGFIPEIVFMSCLFGYLILLIFYKWTAYDGSTSKDAPSLLIAFINMCLFNYNDPTNKALYKGQVKNDKSSLQHSFHIPDPYLPPTRVFTHKCPLMA